MQNCPFCGTELEKHNVYGDSKEKKTTNALRYCPKCHKYVDSNQYVAMK